MTDWLWVEGMTGMVLVGIENAATYETIWCDNGAVKECTKKVVITITNAPVMSTTMGARQFRPDKVEVRLRDNAAYISSVAVTGPRVLASGKISDASVTGITYWLPDDQLPEWLAAVVNRARACVRWHSDQPCGSAHAE